MLNFQDFVQGQYEGLASFLALSFLWYQVGAIVRWTREYLGQ